MKKSVKVTLIVAAALVLHGFGMKLSGRMDGGAPFEKIRKWDAKHPDQEIGTYADPVAGGPDLHAHIDLLGLRRPHLDVHGDLPAFLKVGLQLLQQGVNLCFFSRRQGVIPRKSCQPASRTGPIRPMAVPSSPPISTCGNVWPRCSLRRFFSLNSWGRSSQWSTR